MNDDKEFNEIIPTAILTAYPRTLSDIPFSNKIFAEIKKYYDITEDLIVDNLAPELEARHKIIDKLLRETEIMQVLEIASGFSSRGLNFAKNNSEAQYVEIDRPDLMRIKEKILKNITDTPENLHLLGGNALCKSDFEKATEFFDPRKPVVIINEGFLRYLTFDEKSKFAKNVKFILKKYGGVWISGDGATQKFRHNQERNINGVNRTILAQTRRSNLGNAFKSQKQIVDFFSDLGFAAKFREYAEIQNELNSPKKLNFSYNEVREKLLKHASAIILRLKKEND